MTQAVRDLDWFIANSGDIESQLLKQTCVEIEAYTLEGDIVYLNAEALKWYDGMSLGQVLGCNIRQFTRGAESYLAEFRKVTDSRNSFYFIDQQADEPCSTSPCGKCYVSMRYDHTDYPLQLVFNQIVPIRCQSEVMAGVLTVTLGGVLELAEKFLRTRRKDKESENPWDLP